MSRGDLTGAEWRILKGLLPMEPANRGRGGRPEQNRAIINGILWRLRCGAPWRDVPPKYGSWNTIYRRFRRWSEAVVWETVAVTLAEMKAEPALSGLAMIRQGRLSVSPVTDAEWAQILEMAGG